MHLPLSTLVFVANAVLVLALVDMDTVYRWKYIDYLWESDYMKEKAINSGDYNYTEVVPMDVDQAPDGRIFVTFLGTYGTPAVLGTVADEMGPAGPLIKPYPDWSWFKKEDCDSIRNVYRIAIDKCERLWVLDNGFLENDSGENVVDCGAQLLVFNLKDDSLIDRYRIPSDIAVGTNDESLLASPIVETYGDKCEDTTVYISDTWGFGLIIWNNGKWSRLEDPVFEPSKEAINITSGGQTVMWDAGVVTMDITPEDCSTNPRQLYFHSLSSFDLHAANVSELKRATDATAINFKSAKNILQSQAIGVAFSSQGTLFIGLIKEPAIACWNKYRPLEPVNVEIVAQDKERLEYANGMKVIRGSHVQDDELLVLTNRFIAYGSYNFNEYNFHVLKKSVKMLVESTVCEYPSQG